MASKSRGKIAPQLDQAPSTARKIMPALGGWILAYRESLVVLVILAINLVLVSPSLMPALAWINPHDEAKYVDSGWRLLGGNLRDISWGPLVAFLYAPIHLIVGDSPNWFLLEDWIGRFLLFISLWLSMYVLVRQFRDQLHPYLFAGILLVNIPFFLILENQSDAIFVSLSMLGLANLIQFHRKHDMKSVWIASIFVGLGVLARFEQILLLGVLVLVAVLIGRGYQSFPKIVLAALLPAGLVLLLYLASSVLLNGSISLGISGKSYLAFEDNQPVPAGANYKDQFEYARSLFGTPEENNYSVPRAILRNPVAYAKRLIDCAMQEPDYFLSFFGKKLGPLMLLFTVWGVVEMLRQRRGALLLIMILWALPATICLSFLPRHLVPQTCYLPIILGGIGMGYTFRPGLPGKERLVIFSSIGLLFLVGWLGHLPALIVSGFLIMVTLGLVWICTTYVPKPELITLPALLLLLSSGLILHGSYPFPNYPLLGTSREELGIHFLENNYPALTPVLVQAPLPAVAARMVDIDMSQIPEGITTGEGLAAWLQANAVPLLYIDLHDHHFKDITELVVQSEDSWFELLYQSEDNDLRIYQVIR